MGGGDSPAVVLTDQSKFDAFASTLLDAVTQGTLPLGNLLGGVTSTLSGLSLPLLLSPPSSSDGQICNELYSSFVNRMRGTVLPALSATSLSGGSTITLGTTSSPVTVYWDSASRLQGGQTLTGHGTLIVTDEPMVSLTQDPYWETADTDTSNNAWPRKAVPSRLELYKTQRDKDNLMKDFNEKLKTK